MRVFVASSFGNRHAVRHVHGKLRDLGMGPTSSWAYADAPPGAAGDWFFALPADEQARIVATDDADLATSHVLLMLADGSGGECFAEAERARLEGIPVVWTGRRTTSTIRPGVLYVDTLDAAIDALRGLYNLLTTRCQLGLGQSAVRAVLLDQLEAV